MWQNFSCRQCIWSRLQTFLYFLLPLNLPELTFYQLNYPKELIKGRLNFELHRKRIVPDSQSESGYWCRGVTLPDSFFLLLPTGGLIFTDSNCSPAFTTAARVSTFLFFPIFAVNASGGGHSPKTRLLHYLPLLAATIPFLRVHASLFVSEITWNSSLPPSLVSAAGVLSRCVPDAGAASVSEAG